MTGFGAASLSFDGYTVNVEVKTLNSKFIDIMLKIPAALGSMELALKKQISQALVRGKVTAAIEVVAHDPAQTTLLDEQLFRGYYSKFKQLADELEPGNPVLPLALQAPGVLRPPDEALPAAMQERVAEAMSQALQACNSFREQEGQELQSKLSDYLARIGQLLEQVDPLDKERISKLEERLRSNIGELESKVEIDYNRLEQELIYYIEKLDINEEKVRLANHLSYFAEVMDSAGAAGKKLGFIAQEMGREINTLGSKANDARLQRLVVEMKEELEKIKEQLLNVL